MTDDLSRPWDQHAERAVLGEILHQHTVPPELAARVDPLDFYEPKHQWTAEVCWDLTAKQQPCDPASVLSEIQRRRHPIDGNHLASLLGSAFPMPTGHAKTIRDMSIRRQLIVQAHRAIQQANDLGSDPYDTAASLSVQAEQISTAADPETEQHLTDVLDFVNGSVDYDWLVPGLLERGDRAIFTGGEGSGKSWLTRMIGVCVAAGVDPFTGHSIPPLRVLQVDLENPTRHLRRGTQRLISHATAIGRPVQPGQMFIESVPQGCDLTGALDEAWLRRVCDQAQPDLMVIGPLYRMHATDMAKEEPARHLTAVLDSIRIRHECSMLIETHSGHGSGIGSRDLRPVGSSLFRRWPEFGYGLRPENDGTTAMVAWRGARDERSWPTHLARGGSNEWPWIPYNPHKHLRHHWSEEEAS